MSHELFRDVTDIRPRGNRATGGTLAVSIVAHALILAAVIGAVYVAANFTDFGGELTKAFSKVGSKLGSIIG